MQAILALEDGSVFHGKSIGIAGKTMGEVVFNTSMTGYQEILTDPSYSHQIVTLTYPHIGNTGINPHDNEASTIYLHGLIIRDLPLTASNFRSEESLSHFLSRKNIVAIADIDTRRLTRLLRTKGALKGVILAAENITETDIEQAILDAQRTPSLNGADLARVVTTQQRYEWLEGSLDLDGHAQNVQLKNSSEQSYHIVAYDFGIKQNILRLLADRGCKITVLPATTPVEEVLALNPDGVFLSNGPGDPAACDYAIKATRVLLEHKLPLFGICLGHQILALASGAKTVKMKFGHHGANHPVQDLVTQKVQISVQNHGFAVDESSLPAHLTITHKSLFDHTIQGIKHNIAPAFGFQGHPEASPGSHDLMYLFDQFIELMTVQKHQHVQEKQTELSN